MKHPIILVCLLFTLQPIGLLAQQFYVKPHARYHIPIATQESPFFFDLNIAYPFGQEDRLAYNSIVKDFTLAQRINYGCQFGVYLNDTYAVELAVDYFNATQNFEGDNTDSYAPIMSTLWKLSTLSFTPTLKFGQSFNSITVNAKVGLLLGLTNFQKSYYRPDNTMGNDNDKTTLKMDPSISLGYSCGLEVNYRLKSNFLLSCEFGLESLVYTPKKGKIIEDFRNGYEYNYVSTKEIEYAQHVENYNPNEHKLPQQRLSETLELQSVFFDFGIIYEFNK